MAWWNNRRDQITGQVLLTGYFADQWRRSDRGIWATTKYTAAVGAVWWPQLLVMKRAGLGRVAWGIIGSPHLMAAAIPIAIGAGVSYAIDPEEGLENYGGFLTGGYLGNNPNYWDSDDNNSGYFNVNQNFVNIISANRRNERDKANKKAEAEYIQAYWARKAAIQEAARRLAQQESFGIYLEGYNAMSEFEQQTYLYLIQSSPDFIGPRQA